MEENWAQKLAIKALHLFRLEKQAAGNHRQDMTGPVLQNLLQDGYTQVTWNSNGSHHSQCRDLNRQVWDLQDFLNTTEYDAPLFSRSHPGDQSCTLIVSGQGLPNVEVDSYGDVDSSIGTSRPVTTPVAPKPKVRVAPKVEPKIERVPEKPKEKIVYVPKEVHKQIKDPFEKHDLSLEEYEEMLNNLENENVNESIPTPEREYTDEELDEMRNFNKETSLRIPKWIKGIFEK